MRKQLFYSFQQGGFFDTALHAKIPEDAVEITPSDHVALLEGCSAGKRIVAGPDGQPVLADPPPQTIDELAIRQRAAISAALADALAVGMPHTMPDGTEDVVQMLAEDRQNLLGLAIEARDLKAAGVTTAAQEFRAASNSRYPMTPDQVIAMTDAALSHYKSLLQRSWDRKDDIDVALAAGDREDVEAVMW